MYHQEKLRSTLYKMGIKLRSLLSIKSLLIFTIIGFLTGFDYTDSWGCVILPNFFFSTPLSLLTLMSILVFYITRRSSNSNFVRKLLAAELVFYILRLIVFKGGYAVGFYGVPDSIILIYDVIALGLRIFLLMQLFSFKLHPSLGAVIIIGILIIKSTFFGIPPYYVYQEHINLKTRNYHSTSKLICWT